ncbi:MAG: biosynthetic-type acetolactate synthase large subunit [Actinobacteria bacterium]|nr:biosynthetic-type acetolactate synthase large subunit [Actinomycetota bacterium]
MKLKGAEILIESLKREGVKLLFGYPGGANLAIYDALRNSDLRHVLTRHEQGAAHAADGYARSTGEVGVCLATSGPGATNLLTGVAAAYMDSTPMVVLTGQVPVAMVGTDAFQEVDVFGATMPFTKHNYLVTRTADVARVVREAFHIARTGRPGPVLVDLPSDVLTGTAAFLYPDKVDLPGYKPTREGHPVQVNRLAEALNRSERPVLYVGGGVIKAGAEEEVRTLAEKTNTPVVMTLMGLGAFPGTHPLSLGMLGLHGTPPANYAVSEAGLIVAVGARFDNRVTGAVSKFAPKAQIAHIDVDPAEIGKNVRVDIPVVGDARLILKSLLGSVSEKPPGAWNEQVAEWKQKFSLKPEPETAEGKIRTPYVIEQIYQATQGRAIVTTDVGQHQMWAAHHYLFDRPRQMVTSGGLGSMGFGFPAAIGAQIGNPAGLVVAITGDGSFQMNMQELATALEQDLPIKIMVLTNRSLGMVRQLQEFYSGKRYFGVDLKVVPDFAKLAGVYGVWGRRVTGSADVRPAIEEALLQPGLAVVDFEVAPEENVFPMVLTNSGLDEMILD